MLALYALVVCGVFSLASPVARADVLDDQFQSAWESLWDERGFPRVLLRWDRQLVYRIHGSQKHRNREQMVRALQDATSAAGLTLLDVSEDPDAEKKAQLHIEIMADHEMKLEGNMCYVRTLDWGGGLMKKMELKARVSNVWHCAHHEAMHVMGVPGHPSGNTVLSYFGRRPDALSEFDVQLLRAWYAKNMPLNATPLDAINLITQQLATHNAAGLSVAEAMNRAESFMKRTVAQMTAFASSQGEVPPIVRRSGRASEESIREGRGAMAFYLGLAYSHGRIPALGRDSSQLIEWMQRSADAGYAPGQYVLGVHFKEGGASAERTQARRWLKAALAGGITAAQLQLDELDQQPNVTEKIEPTPPQTGGVKP